MRHTTSITCGHLSTHPKNAGGDLMFLIQFQFSMTLPTECPKEMFRAGTYADVRTYDEHPMLSLFS